MERSDQGSPLPPDPAGREDIMSGEQSGRQDTSPDGPQGGAARAGAGDSPLTPDPAGREDVIRENIRDEKRPGGAAAGS
ncbi:MAG TPA: hypothetical protein VFQ68_29795 [Streptosporangiaceae bacterium]|nr:hypothetical protein [Streptosporangiaceae bacterium]